MSDKYAWGYKPMDYLKQGIDHISSQLNEIIILLREIKQRKNNE